MPTTPLSRPVAESVVDMTEIVLPEDTNPVGTIFGGRVLALVDKCAAIAAVRHARCQVLTVSMDSVEFHNPVRLADVLILKGRLNAAFRSSMEVEVEVLAEDPATGDRRSTTRAFVTMVAVDEDGRPTAVPHLTLVTAVENARAEQARIRRDHRLR